MDWVGPLPKTKNGYNSVLVIVDRLSKWVYYIPTTTTSTAVDTAELIWKVVVRNHGMPKAIVSDRDPRFLSLFWEALWKLCGTNLKMSTPYHPQTDGQTERASKKFEEILRTAVNFQMNDWDEHLIPAEIAVNTSKQDSTGFSPAYLNTGKEFRLPLEIAKTTSKDCRVEKAVDFVMRLNKDVEKAREAILKAQESQKIQADKRRREVIYKVGDKVMVSLRDWPQNKLACVNGGEFTVTKVISNELVELDWKGVPRTTPRIHVSKLTKIEPSSKERWPGRQQISRPFPETVNGEHEWEVEKIIKVRYIEGKKEYLVKWVGYPDNDNTWLPQEDLKNASDLLRKFNGKNKKRHNNNTPLNNVNTQNKSGNSIQQPQRLQIKQGRPNIWNSGKEAVRLQNNKREAVKTNSEKTTNAYPSTYSEVWKRNRHTNQRRQHNRPVVNGGNLRKDIRNNNRGYQNKRQNNNVSRSSNSQNINKPIVMV